MRLVIELFLLMAILQLIDGRYQFLSAVSGDVQNENFTYYSLTYDGTILLELTSTSGDCDLYVSQYTINPTYEPHNNCLQSTTCGLDVIIVPKSFKRPLGLGIFGHPSHTVSQYILTISRVDDSLDMYNFDSYNESLKRHHYNKRHNSLEKGDSVQDGEEEEEVEKEESNSLYWILLKYLLKCLIEVFSETIF